MGLGIMHNISANSASKSENKSALGEMKNSLAKLEFWEHAPDDRAVCWNQLDKVSRSFALCIRVLPKPMDEQLMVAYLLYRVIDTVEDSGISIEKKGELFRRVLSEMSRRKYSEKRALECRDVLCAELDSTKESELLLNFDGLMRVYFAQPHDIRRAIVKWGRVMEEGMYSFLEKRIETFNDQNWYSYYVAGVVGYLINDILFYNKVINAKLRRKLRVHAKRFGLALQKVNILRDVAKDIREGRYYWPREVLAKYGLTYEDLCRKENREAALKVLREQIADASQYLHSAIYYVISLPRRAIRVRMFCLIPLFMAIESFAKCVDNAEVFESGRTVKISRMKVYEILIRSGIIGVSNGFTVRWFRDSMGNRVPVPSNSPIRSMIA